MNIHYYNSILLQAEYFLQRDALDMDAWEKDLEVIITNNLKLRKKRWRKKQEAI